MKSWTMATVSVSLVGALHVAACASSTGGVGTGGVGGDGSTQDSSTQGSSTQGSSTQGSSTQGSSTQGSSTQGSSTSSSSSASSGGGGACSTLPTYYECDECECTKHLAGCDAYIGFLDAECACSAGAPCATACASYCGGGDFDAACDTCFNGLGENACWEAAYTACVADTACNDYVTASDASCASLP